MMIWQPDPPYLEEHGLVNLSHSEYAALTSPMAHGGFVCIT
jgi:hypothetical protein